MIFKSTRFNMLSVHESCQHFTGHSVRQSMKVCLTDKNFVCPKNSARFGKIIKGGGCVCVGGGGGGGGVIINFYKNLVDSR